MKNIVFNITAIEIGHAGKVGLAGGDRLFEEMTKRIPKGGYSFEVVTSAFGSHHWQKSGVQAKLFVLPSNPFETRLDSFSVFISYLIRVLQTSVYLFKKRGEIEILYSSTNILPDILPCFIAKLVNPKIKWLCRIHHLIPPPSKREGKTIVNIFSYLMQSLVLFCAKSNADLTLALNSNLLDSLLNKGFQKDKLAILGAGIDFDKIAKYTPRKKESFDGVYLGRLHPAKGIFDTLDIWEKVTKEKPEAKLAIIGEGSEEIKKELFERIGNKDLGKKIMVLGYLPENRVYDILKSAKVFLFTDHEAGWGLAMAEAMACKTPVVAYNLKYLKSIFNQGFVAVPLGETEKFAEEIIHLLKDRNHYLKLSKSAFVESKNHSWDSTTRKFTQLITRLKHEKD